MTSNIVPSSTTLPERPRYATQTVAPPFASDVVELITYKCTAPPGQISVSCPLSDHALKCRAQFFVHSSLLCRISDVFNRELNGSMREARERKIELVDWDYQTVERVVEFLYTGDYRNLKPEKLSGASESNSSKLRSAPPTEDTQTSSTYYIVYPQEKPTETKDNATPPSSVPKGFLDGLWGGFVSSLKNIPPDPTMLEPTKNCAFTTGSQSKKKGNSDQFCDDPPIVDILNVNSTTNPSQYPLKSYRYANVLLSHSSLYAFADMYNITPLRLLSYNRIKEILCTFTGSDIPRHILDEDLFKLILYTYDSTVESEAAPEPLRNLLSTYAAWNIKSLTGTVWDELVSHGGDFVKDLFKKVKLRMRAGQNVDESELPGEVAGHASSEEDTYTSRMPRDKNGMRRKRGFRENTGGGRTGRVTSSGSPVSGNRIGFDGVL